ncbi:MAG: MotA/TolQ/ExbB proton channel family protein [Campylobacterota bacterium]|nr:MotA/TolQ/ExbB proton channel family protein [Campylobacterota bacterium]
MDTLDRENGDCLQYFWIILSVPLFVLVSVTLGYIGILPLKVEMHTLSVVAIIFTIFAFFVKHNANYSICQMRGNKEQMEHSLKKALDNNALSIMDEVKSTLNVHEYIQEYYKDIRNDNFAQVAPSIFPMLGILGTFIAIAISMPDFTVKDVTALDQEITVLLAGIGTAFYASIYGIFLSIWWTYFEKRGVSKADSYIVELEKLYESHIWKKSELIKHEHMQNELKDQEIVKTLKETFSLDFVKELNDQYMKNFKVVLEDTMHTFTTLTDNMGEASRELRDTISLIESRKESINAVETIRENIEAFNGSASNLNHTIDKFDTSLDKTFVKVDSEVADIVNKLGEFATIISEQNRQIQKSLELQKEQKIDV